MKFLWEYFPHIMISMSLSLLIGFYFWVKIKVMDEYDVAISELLDNITDNLSNKE